MSVEGEISKQTPGVCLSVSPELLIKTGEEGVFLSGCLALPHFGQRCQRYLVCVLVLGFLLQNSTLVCVGVWDVARG